MSIRLGIRGRNGDEPSNNFRRSTYERASIYMICTLGFCIWSDTLSAVLPPKPTPQCMTAIVNAGRAIDGKDGART